MRVSEISEAYRGMHACAHVHVCKFSLRCVCEFAVRDVCVHALVCLFVCMCISILRDLWEKCMCVLILREVWGVCVHAHTYMCICLNSRLEMSMCTYVHVWVNSQRHGRSACVLILRLTGGRGVCVCKFSIRDLWGCI